MRRFCRAALLVCGRFSPRPFWSAVVLDRGLYGPRPYWTAAVMVRGRFDRTPTNVGIQLAAEPGTINVSTAELPVVLV